MMKLTRRQFLKGLLATTATAAIAPEVLIEPLHGAHDLTPKERDVVADVLGLRQKQWPGVDLPSTRWLRIPVMQANGFFSQLTLKVKSGPSVGGYLVPLETQKRILYALACPERVTRTEHERAYAATASWFWKAEKGEIYSAKKPDLGLSVDSADFPRLRVNWIG